MLCHFRATFLTLGSIENNMNNVAVMYEDGIGVEQDYAQAIHWYQEAAKNGNKSAPAALERLKNSNPELFR